MLAPSHAHGPLAEHLMHVAHKIGNTSGVSKSSLDWLNYTGFLGDVCVESSCIICVVCVVTQVTTQVLHKSVIVATFPNP